MATMHPNCKTEQEVALLIKDFKGSDWERHVYNLAQRYLPASWHVWWNKHQKENGHPHQYDFVVLVPGKGLVNLEAKGAGWGTEEGQTVCKYDGRVTIKKDIFAQAANAQSTLNNCLACKIEEDWGGCSHLIVFRNPFFYSGMEDQYIDDLENRLFKDSKLLERKIATLLNEVQYKRDRDGNIIVDRFERFEKNMSEAMRHLNSECSISKSFNKDDFRLMDDDSEQSLSTEQKKVFSLLSKHDNVHVVGAAGTGKTVIARQLMRHFLADGKKVLYVCYNKALAEDLAANNPSYASGGNGVIVNFDAIPNRDIPGIGKMIDVLDRFPPQSIMSNEDWVKRRDAIDKALEERARNVFDILLVDEAQDLDNRHIFALFFLLKLNRKIVVFSDARQSLFTQNWSLDITMFGNQPPEVHPLTCNWRNTDKIHDQFKEFEEVKVLPVVISDKDVEVVPNCSYALKKVLSEKRQPCDIAVLCPSNKSLGTIPNSIEDSDGRSVKFTEDIEQWRKGNRILKTNIRSFKGLEAPIVILDEIGLDDMSEDRYVGESRAKYELYIVREPAEA